ncbi:cryptic autophosphorylating protein tyrosine kinase Etk [Botrimarina colliarenosi]|uniref:Cryptic autophosphorylating protein tyrosine kinase Etk n=1 Tax=Botrimarina colliarenosi TaxID=2528001 RepID=A0A5C6AHF9_9BACT|nr:hypothetical protein [Botrimarina colliarenosi]TWT97613.1 cryptic autophosphorylating protein tyrosine kinase Etk [Botrimarina colliarenosi]
MSRIGYVDPSPANSAVVNGYTSLPSDPMVYRAPETSQKGGGQLLPAVCRKYWWLLAPVLALSGFVAYQASERFGEVSSKARASVIYRGLPGVPGPTIFEPLAPKTCSELLTSVNVVQKVLDKRGIEMPATTFSELLLVELTRNSSLINVELSWSDPEAASGMLNDLLSEFIEYIASERRATLREHLQHVELALLEAKSNVDLARTRFESLRRQHHEKIFESGGYTEDFYVGLMETASKTRYEVDEEKAQRSSIEQQLAALDEKGEEVRKSLVSLEQQTAAKLLDDTYQSLESARDMYAEGSESYRDIDQSINDLDNMGRVGDGGLKDWHAELTALLSKSVATLGRSTVDGTTAAHDVTLASYREQGEAIQEKLSSIERMQETLQLRLYPSANQIDVLEDRLGALQQESQGSGAPFADFDASRLEESEAALHDAEAHEQAVALQQANMRQLEKCRINEWTISVPAGPQTTAVSSNNLKIGALAFALCTMGLCAPIVFAEWLNQCPTADEQFAQSVGLPLVSEHLVTGSQRIRNSHTGLNDLRPATIEELRHFTLRIQQCCRRTNRGATIVFSSLDPRVSAMPLMGGIAECLAEREERVLLINTVPSEWAASWRAPIDADEKPSGKTRLAKASEMNGLGEYLAAECQELSELIQPTGIRGIDAILCGSRALPREAMASSTLMRLIEECCDRYSMVLVNGPGIGSATDLQLLASQADALVLTTSKRVRKGGAVWEAVADLRDTQAPIIGLVS